MTHGCGILVAKTILQFLLVLLDLFLSISPKHLTTHDQLGLPAVLVSLPSVQDRRMLSFCLSNNHVLSLLLCGGVLVTN